MEAVILVGGLGTRLRPYTWVLPKPLLPLGEMSILEINLRRMAIYGFKRVTLSVGHKASLIRNLVEEMENLPFEIDFLFEEKPLGTAGFLHDFVPRFEKFLVMNGDLLTDLNLAKVIESHDSETTAATIVSVSRNEKIDYGVLICDEANELQSYDEKPEVEYLVSSGIYVLTSKEVKHQDNEYVTMPEILLKLKKQSKKVLLFKSDFYWKDLGRADDYHQAIEDFEKSPDRFLGIRND